MNTNNKDKDLKKYIELLELKITDLEHNQKMVVDN